MELASAGAKTPFITSTPSSAVTLAFAAVGARLGLAAAGVASAAVAGVSASFAVFASLLSATTDTAAMASNSRLDNNFFSVDMDGVLSFRPISGLCTKLGAQTYSISMTDVKKVLFLGTRSAGQGCGINSQLLFVHTCASDAELRIAGFSSRQPSTVTSATASTRQRRNPLAQKVHAFFVNHVASERRH